MPSITCPKCGENQSIENTMCIKCGVIFNKLLHKRIDTNENSPVVSKTPITNPEQKTFLPEIGLKRNIEILILNIFAYIYLILGIGYGIGIILEVKSELALLLGFSVIIGSLVTSMIFFVICTVAKKIINIDNNLMFIIRSLKD